MNIVDIEIYRKRKEQQALEKQIKEIALTRTVDSAGKMKNYFSKLVNSSYSK